jgi:hypothetical protein
VIKDKLAETIKRISSSNTLRQMILKDQQNVFLELDWYLVDWTQTLNTIDYGIKMVTENGEKLQLV